MPRTARPSFMSRQLPHWKLLLAAAIGAAVVIALAIVTASLVLILIPVILAGLLIHRLLGRHRQRAQPEPPASTPRVIEVDYEIIPDDDTHRSR